MRNAFLKCFGLCATLCVVFLYTGRANGQGTTASIVGQVTDSRRCGDSGRDGYGDRGQ